MNKALVEIVKLVTSDLSQEDLLFKKLDENKSDEESKWDYNDTGIRELFDELNGSVKLNKKLENPKKSKTKIAKSYFMMDTFRKAKKNKITRKDKIIEDISNYFFIFAFENGIEKFEGENEEFIWSSFNEHMKNYLKDMKLKYNIK